MPPKAKPKKCTRLVHNGVERVKCDTLYLTDCPKSSDHVLKFKTGFCNNGWHEGTKPKDWRGNPTPTCQFFQTCACNCHVKLDKMFKDVGMERLLVENSEYTPERVDFNIEDYMKPAEDDAPFSDGGADGPATDEGTTRTATRPSVATLATRRTDTGRAARGGLEAQVFEQCRLFTDAEALDLCIPKNIAERIADQYKIPTPSTGAIGAVFDRWTKLGFATTAKKPVRFVGFTGEGTWTELELMKAKAKRQRKHAQSAIRRGFR